MTVRGSLPGERREHIGDYEGASWSSPLALETVRKHISFHKFMLMATCYTSIGLMCINSSSIVFAFAFSRSGIGMCSGIAIGLESIFMSRKKCDALLRNMFLFVRAFAGLATYYKLISTFIMPMPLSGVCLAASLGCLGYSIERYNELKPMYLSLHLRNYRTINGTR